MGEISRCILLYPRIKSLMANPYKVDGNLSQDLQALRDHALDLARLQAVEDAEAAARLEADGDSRQAARRRKNASRLLFKLVPGNASALSAVFTPNGSIVTDPSDIAKVLRSHWEGVFQARGVNACKLRQWIEDDMASRRACGELHSKMKDVQLQRWHFQRALDLSNDSSPGPDGIPYGAWRALGDDAIDLLFEAALEMVDPDFSVHMREEYSDFNDSVLLFLTKKATGELEDGTAVYEAGNVRPLNVTNTDNRLIASAARLAIEPVLATLVSPDQRGFIGGRSMIANLVDIDEAIAQFALSTDDAVALFYDFASAFPSVEHELLHSYFRSLGWPPWLLRLAHVLYYNNSCRISLGKMLFAGFMLTRGIRQGCPLSPLLFTVVSELFLRRLRRTVADTVNRAWADDLAMVMKNGISRLGLLSHLFAESLRYLVCTYISAKRSLCHFFHTTYLPSVMLLAVLPLSGLE